MNVLCTQGRWHCHLQWIRMSLVLAYALFRLERTFVVVWVLSVKYLLICLSSGIFPGAQRMMFTLVSVCVRLRRTPPSPCRCCLPWTPSSHAWRPPPTRSRSERLSNSRLTCEPWWSAPWCSVPWWNTTHCNIPGTLLDAVALIWPSQLTGR